MEDGIKYEHASFWIEDDGILYCKLSNLMVDNKLDYKTALLFLDAIQELSKGEPVPLLIDLKDAKGTFSIAGAQLLSKSFNSMPLITCEAYVVNSLSVKLLVQAYKRIYDTKIPYAIFNTMTTAREYCLKFKN